VKAAREHTAAPAAIVPGSTQTQWWLQEIGETSTPTSPTSPTAANSRPERCVAAATHSPNAATTNPTASHGSRAGSAPCRTRVKNPFSDWFPTYGTPPTCSGRHHSRVQNRTESPGSSTHPSPAVAANEASAVPAARRRPVNHRCTAKIAGVSLIPAAIPTSTPRGSRPVRPVRSASTSATSSRLTWPSPSVPRTGSSHTSPAATSATSPAGTRRRSAVSSEIRTTVHRQPSHSAADSSRAVPQPSSATGANRAAANGGYVNGSVPTSGPAYSEVPCSAAAPPAR
jgi:hypothetical protein